MIKYNQTHTQKPDGIIIIVRQPTNKLSRGKVYPSIDIRSTPIEKILNRAAKHNLVPMFVYQVKYTAFYMPITCELIGRTTISCKYGKKFDFKAIKQLIGKGDHEEMTYATFDPMSVRCGFEAMEEHD